MKAALYFCLAIASIAVLTVIGHLRTDLARTQEADARLAITRIDNANFPDMTAIVSVTDASGRPVTGLEAGDFQLEENGRLVPSFALRNEVDADTPILIVLALDTSGSMEGEKLTSAKRAAHQLFATLSRHDKVSLVAFADTADIRLEPTSAKETVVSRTLDALRASGNTALYDGAYQALRVANGTGLVRRAVVLLTDGEDFGGVSIGKKEDVLRLAESTGVPVYAIGLGQDADRGLLQELSALTGGEALFATSQEEIGGLFDRIGELLRNQYRITYRSQLPADSRTYPLVVRVTVAAEQLEANASFKSRPVEPEIAVDSLETLVREGDAPSATIELVPALSAQGPVTKVEFLIDGDVVHTATAPPFRYVLNADALSRGDHIIALRATDASGNVGVKEYRFELRGTAFNWGLLLLAAGVGTALAFATVLYYRMRRHRPAHGP